MPPTGNQPHGIVEEWPAGLTRALPTDHWLVVHAFPRQDKKLIENLRNLGLPCCAFFERRIRVYPGKGKQESIVPLLGGYVFVAADERAKDAIYQTNRVVRIIDVRQPKDLAADLACLCSLIAVATTPLVVRPDLVAGKRITISQGTFSGCSGVISKRQNQVELIINLELLGHSVSVALPAQFAELITD
jgi:transcription antitermination factor NusG